MTFTMLCIGALLWAVCGGLTTVFFESVFPDAFRDRHDGGRDEFGLIVFGSDWPFTLFMATIKWVYLVVQKIPRKRS
jgi:hypothetical protein